MPTAMQAIKNDTQARNFRPDPDKRIEVPDAYVKGLYLVVQSSGKKTFAVRYRAAGKPVKMTIGPYPTIALSDARDRARAVLEAVAKGQDPAADKKERTQADKHLLRIQVADFMERWAKRRNRSWKTTQTQFENFILPAWGDRDIASIRRREVIALLDDIAERKIKRRGEDGKERTLGGPIVANRVLATLRKFFNWLLSRDVIETAPTAHVKAPAPENKRDRTLADTELAEIWLAAEKMGYPFGPMVKLLALTAARRDEIAQARWSWLTPKKDALIVPAAFYKTNKPMLIPLVPAAQVILQGLPQVAGCDYIFPASHSTKGRTELGAMSGFSSFKRQLDAHVQAARTEAGEDDPMPTWRLHDLRRTVRTGLSELKVQPHIAEAVLGHVVGGIQAHYDLHDYADEKREALEKWEARIVSAVKHTA